MLFKCFKIGRQSAVGSMRAKAASFVMVTLGLFLCTFEEHAGRPPAAPPPAAAAPPALI